MAFLRCRNPWWLIVAGIVACHSFEPVGVPQPNRQLEGNPQVVIVTRRDESEVTIYQPTVRGDSVIGWLEKPAPDTSGAGRVAVSLSDVREISVPRFDGTATAVLVLGTGIVAFILFAVLFIFTFEGS
jgi:hypothetical protein